MVLKLLKFSELIEKRRKVMIITAGLVAGTFALASQYTPLQPVNVTRVDNNTTKVFAAKDTTIHLSNTKAFEIIAYTDEEVVNQGDYKKSYDIKVKKGQTLYIDAQTGYNTESYKIGNKSVTVFSTIGNQF